MRKDRPNLVALTLLWEVEFSEVQPWSKLHCLQGEHFGYDQCIEWRLICKVGGGQGGVSFDYGYIQVLTFCGKTDSGSCHLITLV